MNNLEISGVLFWILVSLVCIFASCVLIKEWLSNIRNEKAREWEDMYFSAKRKGDRTYQKLCDVREELRISQEILDNDVRTSVVKADLEEEIRKHNETKKQLETHKKDVLCKM